MGFCFGLFCCGLFLSDFRVQDGVSISRQDELRAAVWLGNCLESFWGADGTAGEGGLKDSTQAIFRGCNEPYTPFCFPVEAAHSGRHLPSQVSQAHPMESLSFFSEMPFPSTGLLRDPTNIYWDIGDAT